MDLPIAERKVDIFTYVSRFSAEQVEKRDMEDGVPRSIQTNDGDLDPETKKERIMTSDQKVLNVAVRKEAISKKLQLVMKEVAIDCTINAADNEPDIRCFTLDASSKNPYAFDPNLAQDKITTESELVEAAPAVTSAMDPVPKAASKGLIAQKISVKLQGKKRSFILSPFHPATGKATIHALEDVLLKTPLGECVESPGTASGIGSIRFYKQKLMAVEEAAVEEAPVEEAAVEEAAVEEAAVEEAAKE